MPEAIIPIGSVVMLNSGGPKMTVTHYTHGLPVCQYFVNDKLEELRTFKQNLTLIKDNDDE